MKTSRSALHAVFAAFAFASSAIAQTYQVTDIGLLNGAPTYATAISDNGVVCGYALPTASTAKAWVFYNNALTELPGLGGSDTRAMAVAMDGKIYGSSANAGGLIHAVRWENGVIADLGPAGGLDGWFPQAVNAGGVIAGHTGTASAPVSAFTMGASFASIPPLTGATPPVTNAAFDINDAGAVVGVSSWVGGGTRAFRNNAGGSAVSLGTLGANDSTALGINTAGDVVGYSVNASNQTRAFLFTDSGGMRDLGVLAGCVESRADAVNDTGLVVGSCDDASGNSRAFLWNASGAVLDLNPLIPPNGGWVLNEARSINGGGDIVGNGMFGGQSHAFIIERFDGADTLAPIVSGTVATFNGAPSSTVTVNFWDNEKVVGATTYAPGLIRITGPNGFDVIAARQSWYQADRQASVSTFTFAQPGGLWDGADNGVYEIRLAPNVVSDLAGNTHPGGVIGTFTVGMQTVPVLNWITLPSTATGGVPVNLSFGAFGSYPAASGDLFTVSVDWDGDGATIVTFPGRASNAIVAHTFTSTGTHTVRVRVTDPHGLQSSGRTAAIAVANANVLPFLSENTAAVLPAGVTTNGAVATIQNGKLYMFGTQPWANLGEEVPIYTWNFLPGGVFNAGAPFVSGGHMDVGPLTPERVAIDGQGRIVVYRAQGGSTYTSGGGVGGSIASKPGGYFASANAVDNTGRYYAFGGLANNHRYDASGAPPWTALPALPAGFTPATASYDGAGRIIVFGGTSVYALNIAANSWTQLPNAPASIYGTAMLGADGFIYVFSFGLVWTFNPAGNSVSLAGTTASDHTVSPAVLGADGFIYLIGGYDPVNYISSSAIARIDTRPGSALRAPRITSTPTTTIVHDTPWTYQIASGGKPSPTFSIVRGPVGMTVGNATGLVAWTPAANQGGAQFAVVRAENSAGSAEQFITFNILGVPPDITPPAAVTGISAFNITTTGADLSWSASSDDIGVVAYRLQTRRVGGNRWHKITSYPTFATTAALSWHVTSLPGTAPTYYIVAVDAAGNESARSPITVSFLSPPSLYADQNGTFAGARAIVNEPWIGNVFTGLGNPLPTLTPTAFPAGAVWHSASANSRYFTWTAAAGQEGPQIFTVTASSINGSTSLSRTVTTFPAGTDLIPPSSVGSLVVDQISFDSCRVTWTAATDNYGVVSYNVAAVHREPRRRFHRGAYHDHVVSFTVPAGATQAVISGLLASTSYIVSVTPADAAGLYGYRLTRDIRTLPQPFIVDSTQVTTVQNADGSTTMTWPGYAYYWRFTVECSPDLVNWLPVEPATQWPSYVTTFTFTPEPGVPSRFYRVRATPATTP